MLPAAHCSIQPTSGQDYSFEVTVLLELEFPPGRDTFIFKVIVDGTEFDTGMIDKEKVGDAGFAQYIACRRVPMPDGTTKIESLVFADLSQVENAPDEKFEADMERISEMGIIKVVVGFTTRFEPESPAPYDTTIEEVGSLEISQKAMVLQGQHLTDGAKYAWSGRAQDNFAKCFRRFCC
ncbi:uncharacterized protein BKA55DRAFT_544661 [Fusarium redolens]|uniref:DUF7918 domain-containing protein n=1 Tax=Fusarium redolens TaxID=48865 RepID=A0A9P9G5D8_FUSRE|nr:uncharacterized protein BKA55DRAFT_544661 [Fusarium redolens]KAH7232322.1 hypothetical protein BKA55DRAFT_544661 [Fusarium redolens]